MVLLWGRRASRRALLPAAQAQRRANIARSAAVGIKSHHVPTLMHNLAGNRAAQQRVANALTRLVGVLQDFMKLAGYSLAQAVHATVITRGAEATGWGAGVMRGLTAVAAGVIRAPPDALLAFFVKMVFLYVVKPYRVDVDRRAIERVVLKARSAIASLVAGKDVDLRPIASNLIMAMDPISVGNMAKTIVAEILDTYVYHPYSSSSKGGLMCTLCSSVSGCRSGGGKGKAPAPAARAANSRAIAGLLQRALLSVNELLRVETRALTVTRAARVAMDTYIRSASPEWMRGMIVPAVRTFGPMAARGAGVVSAGLDRINFGAWVARYLAKFGLAINEAALRGIVDRHAAAVRDFLANKPTANIEPLVIDITRAAGPMGLVRGALGTAISRKPTSEFCALCSSAYGMCVR